MATYYSPYGYSSGFSGAYCGYQAINAVNTGVMGLPVGEYVGRYQVDYANQNIEAQFYPVESVPLTIEIEEPKRNPNGYRQRKLKARLNNLPKE